MIQKDIVQGLLFDFGGTIDTGGLHWLHVLYPLWQQRIAGLDEQLYRSAFAHGERTLAMEPIITATDNFLDLLEKKLAIQADKLKASGIATTIRDQKWIADQAYQIAADNCQNHRLIIEGLKAHYRVAMVSNFYGNLSTVLYDFGILDLFETLTESALVGVKKPDPAIWHLGAESLGIAPENLIAIGDSLKKDMEPATSIGCQGIWLQGRGWEDSADAALPELIKDTASLGGPRQNIQPIQHLKALEAIL